MAKLLPCASLIVVVEQSNTTLFNRLRDYNEQNAFLANGNFLAVCCYSSSINSCVGQYLVFLPEVS